MTMPIDPANIAESLRALAVRVDAGVAKVEIIESRYRAADGSTEYTIRVSPIFPSPSDTSAKVDIIEISASALPGRPSRGHSIYS